MQSLEKHSEQNTFKTNLKITFRLSVIRHSVTCDFWQIIYRFKPTPKQPSLGHITVHMKMYK